VNKRVVVHQQDCCVVQILFIDKLRFVLEVKKARISWPST